MSHCHVPSPPYHSTNSLDDRPIVIHKSKRSCSYPISNYVSESNLSPSYQAFLAFLSFISLPSTMTNASAHPQWRNTMIKGLNALEKAHTWEMVPLPQGHKVVSCHLVVSAKHNLDGSIACYKARSVAKGYAQTYNICSGG